MITGELKGKVDRLWTTCWNNGLSNPISVIEQLSYLIFMRRLDEAEAADERKHRKLGRPFSGRFNAEQQQLRWSELRQIPDPAAMLERARAAFEHMKVLPGMEATPYAHHMKDAVFLLPLALVATAVRQIDDMFEVIKRDEEVEARADGGAAAIRKDLKGDLYEYMLSKLSQAGTNGQFRTPRHIIEMMVQLRRPALSDTICDPSCGTAGFLVAAARYVKDTYGPELVTDRAAFERFRGPMFAGYDFDGTMLRIGSMNLLLHGIERPDMDRADSLSTVREHVRDRFTLMLANPPFKGSVDMDLVAEDLLKTLGLGRMKKGKPKKQPAVDEAQEEKKAPGAKTELLFLAQILGALKVGGRAAVIVPDGVLYGSSKAHVALRRQLVKAQLLEGVVSMPAGVFRPYAAVSTAVLLITRTDAGGTENVWFYDMQADGFSLDDKREAIKETDIPDVISAWYTRQPATDLDRTARSFFVPTSEINEGNGFELAINKYRQVHHQVVEHERAAVILKRLIQNELEIQHELQELLELVK